MLKKLCRQEGQRLSACFGTSMLPAMVVIWLSEQHVFVLGPETTASCHPLPVSMHEDKKGLDASSYHYQSLKQQDRVTNCLFQHKEETTRPACLSVLGLKQQVHVIVIHQLLLVLCRQKEQGHACLCLCVGDPGPSPISTQDSWENKAGLAFAWSCVGDPGPSPIKFSTQDSWQNKAGLAFACVLGSQVPHLLNFQHRTPGRTRPGCH